MNQEQRDKLIELPDTEILARTLYGEARGEIIDGVCAVASVIVNRENHHIKRYGIGIANVCLKRKQFSCWNDDDENLSKLLTTINNPVVGKCRIIAMLAVRGLLVDNTDGATHYHHKSIEPYWISGKGMIHTVDIGDHKFYMEV